MTTKAFQKIYTKIDNINKATVTVHATSRAQLDSIYMMLTSHPLVKIVL